MDTTDNGLCAPCAVLAVVLFLIGLGIIVVDVLAHWGLVMMGATLALTGWSVVGVVLIMIACFSFGANANDAGIFVHDV